MAEWEIFWQPWSDIGLEHLRLTVDRDSLAADGWIVRRTKEGPGLRLDYRLRCDGSARVLLAEIRLRSGEEEHRVDLRGNGEGSWADASGRPLPALRGCIDLDVAATPFTNTLPIRRLGLGPGEAAEIAVVYVAVPRLDVTRVAQRYTCLRKDVDGGVYLYENLENGFRAELPVDPDGVVKDYSGQWRRLETRATTA